MFEISSPEFAGLGMWDKRAKSLAIQTKGHRVLSGVLKMRLDNLGNYSFSLCIYFSIL